MYTLFFRHNMKTLLCILLLSFWQPNFHSQPTSLLQEFICDVASQKLSDTDLAEKYMCTTLFHRTDQVGDKVRTLFHMTIEEYRERLRKRQIDPKNIVITAFDNLAIKPVEIIGGTEQVYDAQYEGKHFCYFLLENDKIASLNLIHKGDKRAFFLSYCK